MIKTRVCCYLFLLLFLDSAIQIRPSFHGHNNAFVQDDSEVQYLLENIPISMHKEFTSSVHGSGDSLLNDKNVQDSNPYIHFEPRILDFKERQLGVPHQEIVTLVNRDGNRTIHLTSISGSTQHFHSSFFQDKVIPPLGNTTFNVVFLGRDEGEIDSHLFIHTSDGTFKYQVKGSSISSPYRLHPVVGVKLPLNASFTPLIYMHNPHPEAMQVTEVYSSGGEFQLELPSGEAEGPRELWEIPPYQTKPIIRLHLNAYVEKNHTAYVRLKVNNSDELMVVAVEVEVGNGAGLHWGGNSASINFGMGGSQQPALRYPIVLRNSAKKPIKMVNVISTPVSKALKIEFETMSIPGDTDKPITIGTLIYDWKEGLDLKHYKGKLVIKGIGPGGSNQKLSIPWIVQVIQGGLGINSTLGHYCSPHTNEPRNFTIKNHFKQPIAITNITLKNEAMNYFTIKNFIPNVIKPGENKIIFSLHINVDKLNNDNNIKIDSSILINTNVSTTDIPLLRYDGKVKKIIPDDDDGTMNFGTVSSGTENEAIFALENSNPINIELHGWGVNMPGAVLELMGCKIGPLNNFNKIINNITVCSYSGNQSIKPGYLAIFKIKVKIPNIEEDTIVGDVFVRTSYERLIVPVYMRVAHGKISLKKLTFTNCFPGSICMQQIKIHSTFSRSMRVTFVSSINNDSRIEYIPLGKEEKELPTISKGDNIIGSIKIDPSITCNENCYLGLSLNDSIGNQWLNTMSLPSHTRDSDLNLLNARYSRYLNSTGGTGTTWDNITMRLDTTEVRGHKFLVNIKPYWPSLIQQITGNNNRTFVKFPLTQVGNTSFKNIKIYNPSTKGILLQLVMDCNYPQGSRLYQSLPNKFKQYCPDCKSSIDGEFKLQEGDDDDDERNEFNKLWDIVTASNTLSFYLNSGESKIIKLFYTPSGPLSSSGLLFIRNNLTILEVVRLIGRGVHAQFKFGDRKPGSKLPLLFEITDKHLRDCERDSNNNNNIRKLTEPNLTVKRSFIAKNTGELPINFNSFYINGLECEGYGYRILNCQSFKLNPNGTKKIYIAFTPDFTLSKIERELWISTSLGKNKESEMIVDNNGIVKLTLLTTIPEKSLDKCSIILQRHPFEEIFHWCTTIISGFLLIAVLYFSHSEANLIIKTALEPRSSPVQPSLDLRQLAIQTNNNNNKKDEAEKIIKKKDEPDWNLMNVKKLKNDNNNKNSIIPDWTIEEEKKFKIDMEMKNINIKQNENSEYTIEIIQKKKKIKFDIENKIDSHEHDKLLSSSTKSSPTVNRKYNKKDDDNNEANNILLDNKDKNRNKIIPTTTTTIHQQQQQHNNNNGLYKKYDNNINTSQKQQYSEEETSSTTTESSLSNHEDHINYKDDDYLKTDNNNKLQKKNSATGNKKSNKISLNLTEIITSGGDNCELENNCEDDEFYKDRQENPNKWRGNSLKTSPTTVVPQSPTGKTNNPPPPPSSSHLQSTKPQKAKNIIPKKEKVMPKKIIKLEKPPKSIGFEVKQDKQSSSSSSLPQASGPPPPPPSLSRWGENRARFSDVVARNPDNTSPAFSIPPSSRSFVKQDTMQDHQIYLSHGLNQSTENNNRNIPIIYKPTVEYSSLPTKFTSQQQFFGMQQQDQKNLLEQDGMGINHNQYHNNHRHHQYHHHQHQQQQHQHHSHHQNNRNNYQQQQQRQHNSMSHSYFANTFEPNYERELVPYDDLPETNEPMVELESFDDHGECQFWNDKISSANKLANKTDYMNEPVQKVSEKLPDLTDTFKDNNWVNVETNWKPLYARGAVGEERSGVWGVNTGGVWAAAPWEAPVQPTTSLLQASSLEQTNENSQEHSAGFDPFKSLSSIWSPVTTNWDTLREE